MNRSFSYNVSIALKYGVSSAILLEALQYECSKVSSNTVGMEKSDILKLTGLTEEELVVAESKLTSCGVVGVVPYKGSVSKMHYTVLNESDSEDNNIQIGISTTALVSKKTKREALRDSIKRKFNFDDEVVKQYACDWVDAVFENPNKYMSTQSVKLSIEALKSFTATPSVQIDIFKIAIKGSQSGPHTNLEWSIDAYRKNNRKDTEAQNWSPYETIRADRVQIENGAY